MTALAKPPKMFLGRVESMKFWAFVSGGRLSWAAAVESEEREEAGAGCGARSAGDDDDDDDSVMTGAESVSDAASDDFSASADIG